MFHCHAIRFLFIGALFVVLPGASNAQIIIDGVTDRTSYTDSVSFRVQTNAGFNTAVTLNGQTVAPGIFHVVDRMDYYDLAVTRTQLSDGSTESALVRFIVLSSERGPPERGLVAWTPYPLINSTAAELAGAQLHIVTPKDYPLDLDIPVVAWTTDNQGRARRANGLVTAPGLPGSDVPLRRGHGFGFLPKATASGVLNYTAQLQGLQVNNEINLEAATIWTGVSGPLPGAVSWPTNSRIHVTGNITIAAGSTLTIGAGTIVRLNPAVNITNSGRMLINGTTDQPVIFTATNRVAPEQHTGAWGGFVMRGGSAELIANGTIMTGSGAAASWSFSPASSHRSEQALLMVQSGARVAMTNCYLINQAGQIGNGYFSRITLDHCLLQRAITAGEYEGCTNIINHSAVIEFPAVDGVVDAQIADADYDGIYMIGGTNYFANSLFGFAKDDAIDSGSGGAGTVLITNCWVESALHEALAWSGDGRFTWTYDTVLINCGQGIECGWSGAGGSSPNCYAGRLLSLGNSVGARYGDNYEGTTGLGFKDGFLVVTNSIILHNYRDVWGQPWDDTWNYRVADMDIRNNTLTAPNTNHPNNAVWNPATDAALLVPFMTTPPGAPVGIGIATWSGQFPVAQVTNGVPVRLSSFTTNVISVNYSVEGSSGPLATGTLTFSPGETLKRIPVSIAQPQNHAVLRVALDHPVNGELTGQTQAWFLNLPTNQAGGAMTLVARGSFWKYLSNGGDQGTAWRGLAFDDGAWPQGRAELGYGDNDETTLIPNAQQPTAYFRQPFTVADPNQFVSLSMRLKRDDGGVVYLNTNEIFRTPNMPGGTIRYTNLTLGATAENAVDNSTVGTSYLVAGTNMLAVEIHQQALSSSDCTFDFELLGNPAPRLEFLPFGDELLLYWNDVTFTLEKASSLPGTWTPVSGTSPIAVSPDSTTFYRLRR
jgi:hypothetical protein